MALLVLVFSNAPYAYGSLKQTPENQKTSCSIEAAGADPCSAAHGSSQQHCPDHCKHPQSARLVTTNFADPSNDPRRAALESCEIPVGTSLQPALRPPIR